MKTPGRTTRDGCDLQFLDSFSGLPNWPFTLVATLLSPRSWIVSPVSNPNLRNWNKLRHWKCRDLDHDFLKRPSRHEILPNSRARKSKGKQRKRRSDGPGQASSSAGDVSLVRSARALLITHSSRNSVVCRARFRCRFNCLGASCASHLVMARTSVPATPLNFRQASRLHSFLGRKDVCSHTGCCRQFPYVIAATNLLSSGSGYVCFTVKILRTLKCSICDG